MPHAAAIRGKGRNARPVPFGQPQKASGIDDRPVGFGRAIGQVKKDLRRSDRPTVAIQRHAHHLAAGRVREMRGPAIRRETDRIGDADAGEQPAQLAPEPAVDRAGPRLRCLAHGADPEPALRVCPPVIRPCVGLVRFKRADLGPRPAVQIKPEQCGFRCDEQIVVIHPSGSRNQFTELPVPRPVIRPGQQALAKDVKPEQLLAARMPQRTLAQLAAAVIEDRCHAKALS